MEHHVQHHRRPHHVNALRVIHETKADSLTGFIAGFMVGIIGMYVYVVIVTNF